MVVQAQDDPPSEKPLLTLDTPDVIIASVKPANDSSRDGMDYPLFRRGGPAGERATVMGPPDADARVIEQPRRRAGQAASRYWLGGDARMGTGDASRN